MTDQELIQALKQIIQETFTLPGGSLYSEGAIINDAADRLSTLSRQNKVLRKEVNTLRRVSFLPHSPSGLLTDFVTGPNDTNNREWCKQVEKNRNATDAELKLEEE